MSNEEKKVSEKKTVVKKAKAVSVKKAVDVKPVEAAENIDISGLETVAANIAKHQVADINYRRRMDSIVAAIQILLAVAMIAYMYITIKKNKAI